MMFAATLSSRSDLLRYARPADRVSDEAESHIRAILHVISLLVFSISCLERVTLTRPSKAYNKIAIGSRSPDQLSAEVVAISSTESYLLNSVIERAARR